MTVKTRIIRIGNSQGIRIPKLLLEQSGIVDDVELEVRENTIILHAATQPRKEWDGAFERMQQEGEDALLDADAPGPVWDEEEWQW